MKRILTLLLILIAFISKAQTPVNPIVLGTNTPMLEPSTGRHWFYNGITYGYWQAVSRTEMEAYIASSGTGFARLSGGNSLTGNQSIAGTLSTTGLDNYSSDLSSSYTNRSKIDKGYAESRYQLALGFTPYNSTNPAGYLASINSSMVITALGFTPYNNTNPSSFISGSYTGFDSRYQPLEDQRLRTSDGVVFDQVSVNHGTPGPDQLGAIGVTLPSNSNTYAYFGLTKRNVGTGGGFAMAVGLDVSNNFVIGYGTGRNSGSTIDTYHWGVDPLSGNQFTDGYVLANSIRKTGGTSAEYLMADGSTTTAYGGLPFGSDGQIVGYYDGGVPVAIGRLNIANAWSYYAPTTGSTVNLTNNGEVVLNPSGSIAALTLFLPSSPADGDVCNITAAKAITTISYTNGTVVGALATASAGTQWHLIYRSADSTWY